MAWLLRALVAGFVLIPQLAAAQNGITVHERATPTAIRVIAGSASTGNWAPSHATGSNRSQVEAGISRSAIQLCANQRTPATDCQILTTFGPGPSCGTVARSTGFIVAGTGATPEAARAAALAACQQGGRRCTASTAVYCYR